MNVQTDLQFHAIFYQNINVDLEKGKVRNIVSQTQEKSLNQ